MRQTESIDIIATEVRDQLAAQLRHFERLDAQAGVLLGFAGLFVALSPESSSSWVVAARLSGVVSAVFALFTLQAHDLPILDVTRLRKKYISSDPVATRRAILDTHIAVLEEARRVIDQKTRRLKATTGALCIAIVLSVVGLLIENGL